jgi:hypothetical protein
MLEVSARLANGCVLVCAAGAVAHRRQRGGVDHDVAVAVEVDEDVNEDEDEDEDIEVIACSKWASL